MLSKFKYIVLHPTPCTDGTTLASARIARFLSSLLHCSLVDGRRLAPVPALRDATLFIVNGPFAFCTFRDWLLDLVKIAARVIWVQNDYNIDIPTAVPNNARDFRLWTTCIFAKPKFACQYVPWNRLTYKPQPTKQWRIPGVVYYGAYRETRARAFIKYLGKEAPYPVHLSTTTRGRPAFQHVCSNATTFYQPFSNVIAALQEFQMSLYIESDTSKNKVPCESPANRFYEAVSAGVAIAFDVDSLGNLQIDKVPVDDRWVVTSSRDVSVLLSHSAELATAQSILRADYYSDLVRAVHAAIAGLG